MDVGTKILATPRRASVELDGMSVRRVIAVMCLIAIAVIHLIDVPDKFEEVPYIGWLFIGLIAVSLLLAEALMRHDDARAWLLAGLVGTAVVTAYVLSRSVGLPGEHGEEVGNWKEGLGLASLMVEGLLVYLAAARLAQRQPAAD
jgi:hypothetical protein